MRRIVELDGLRAFAILAVMACHFYPFSTMLFKLPEFGWAGVELFFVLSGFLITTILLKLKTQPHPYKVFYLRRVLRIFPPYYAVLGLIFIIAVLQHDSFSWLRFGGKVLFLQSFSNEIGILKHILQVLTGAQPVPNPFVSAPLHANIDRFPVSGFSNGSGPTWSLSIEEWFYILWAPMVLHLRRRTLGFACVAVCIAALFIRWFGFIGIFNYFDFFSRIDALLGGALLALWIEHRLALTSTAQKRGDVLLLAASASGAGALLLLLWTIGPVLGYEIRESITFCVFGFPLVGLCFAGLLSYIIRHADSGNSFSRFLRLKPLVAIGTISYTLYLVHVPVYFLVNQAAARMRLPTSTYAASVAISLISALVSLCVAQLSFLFFEKPILNYKDRLSKLIASEVRME